jgi:hypothetical protein
MGYVVLILTAASVAITVLVSIKIRNKVRRRTAVHHSGTG